MKNYIVFSPVSGKTLPLQFFLEQNSILAGVRPRPRWELTALPKGKEREGLEEGGFAP